MKTYSGIEVEIILKNFAKDNELPSGLQVKKWWKDWLIDHPRDEHAQFELPEGRDLRSELIKFAKHTTGKDFSYSIAYGQIEPYCKTYKDFTCEQIVDEYLVVLKNLQ